MSNTNQVCITCTQRDTCQYYDPNRTICVPVKVSDYGQFAGSLPPTTGWQQVHIQAAIAALNGLTSNPSFEGHTLEDVITECVTIADALIAELQKKGGGYASV